MSRTPEEILRSIIVDVEGMQSPNGEDWFGGFSQSYDEWVCDGDSTHIEWPNLRILIDEAKTALYFETHTRIPDGAHRVPSIDSLPPSATQITLHSSHGVLFFDAAGRLLRADIDSDEWEWIDTPQRLDIAEWQAQYPGESPFGEHDILDWGFWTEYEYVGPEQEWRDDVNCAGAVAT